MSLPSAIKLPLAADVAAALREIDAFDERLWQPHFNTGYYSGDWSGIALRSRGGTADLYPGFVPPGAVERPFASTEILARSPALRALLSEFACATTSVRLLRLGAGAAIREHRDYGIGLDDGEVRVHVALQTSDAVEFVLDGAPVPMWAGEFWYLDVTKPHSVVNASAERRIHLVVDCLLDPWLRDVLTRATRTPFDRFAAAVALDAELEAELLRARSDDEFTALAVRRANERGVTLDRDDVASALARGSIRRHVTLEG